MKRSNPEKRKTAKGTRRGAGVVGDVLLSRGLTPALSRSLGIVLALALALAVALTAGMLQSPAEAESTGGTTSATSGETAASDAQSSSILDRVEQVTAEEQAELLEHARIGTHHGALTSILAEEDYPEADIYEYESIMDIAASLSANKLDYGFLPEATALLYMRTYTNFTYLSPGVYDFDIRYGLGKGNDELREKLNAAIAKLKADGTIDAVLKKWQVDGDYSMDDIPVREDGEVLRVACSATGEPALFVQDGEIAGSDAEITMRLAYEMGMRVEFENMTFAGELAAVATGRADLAVHYVYTEERAENMDFSDVVFVQHWVAATLDGDDETEQPGLFEMAANNFYKTFLVENRWKMILNGLGVTAAIALSSFVLATLGGALLCWMNLRGGWTRQFSRAYVKIVTGIPTLVWLMLLYYVVFKGVDIPAIAVAIICFGLESSAPLSGIFRTGLAVADKGQVEASLAIGFSRAETFRHVVFPQAANAVWGLYSGQLTSLIKATSIVGYIAITDLTKVSDIIRARTFDAFFPLVATALVYFAAIALCAWLLGLVAKRIDPKRRDAATILKGIVPRGGEEA